MFALALVLGSDGDKTWTRVGREPSPYPFNSLVELENAAGIPRNPFVNAGALVIVDRLLNLTTDARHTMLGFLRTESGGSAVDFDAVVATSEAIRCHRNAAEPRACCCQPKVISAARRRPCRWPAPASATWGWSWSRAEPCSTWPTWPSANAGEAWRARSAHRGCGDLHRRAGQAMDQAGGGASNRQVSMSLFLSVKTVEATLTRVYRKLGVRSRTQLGISLRER